MITSTALLSFSYDEHHKTDAAKRKGGNKGGGLDTVISYFSTNYVMYNDILLLNFGTPCICF